MFLIYFVILLLSAATLLFEITLTMVFSVAEWHQFAFMVVSLALLGFGVSGSFLSLFPRLMTKKVSHMLVVCAAAFSLGCLLVLVSPSILGGGGTVVLATKHYSGCIGNTGLLS